MLVDAVVSTAVELDVGFSVYISSDGHRTRMEETKMVGRLRVRLDKDY